MTTSFSTSAMLVSLNLHSWSARREDKRITREVADTHGTTRDAGRYNKLLVPKECLAAIVKCDSAIRQYHYTHTLPWMHDGVAILPVAEYPEYKPQMSLLIDARENTVREFERDWNPVIIPAARRALNGMFDINDYPADIGRKFGCSLKFMPIPDASDFRVDIANTEREILRSQIEEHLTDASMVAKNEMLTRLYDCVKAMADKLSAYKVTTDSNGKEKSEGIFRDSLVENLRERCELTPRLNFTNDKAVDDICKLVERELLGATAEQLRSDDSLRNATAESAEDIAKRIAEFMV